MGDLNSCIIRPVRMLSQTGLGYLTLVYVLPLTYLAYIFGQVVGAQFQNGAITNLNLLHLVCLSAEGAFSEWQRMGLSGRP